MRNEASFLPLVGVVIVNYNGLTWNKTCLSSIIIQKDVLVHVFFVDNNSIDGSLEAVRAAFYTDGRITLLPQRHNLLFAAGCNAGIERALSQDTEFILLLNNDTIMEQGCLAALCDFLRAHPKAAAVQPLLVRMDAPHLVASAGCRFSRMGGAWDASNGAPAASLSKEPSEVPGVTAGAALWRTDVLRHIGLFDTAFGMYFEDVDLSLRARKAGHSLYLLPTATVRHAVSATTSKEPPSFLVRLCYANALRIILKHWPTRWLATDCCVWFLVTSAALLSTFFKRGSTAAKGHMQGLSAGLRLVPKALFRRLRHPHPENDALRSWIDRKRLYPPRPEV